MNEVEVKVLDIDAENIRQKLESLSAEKTAQSRLFVDWFWRKEDTEGNEPWFLRVRSTSDGKSEVTWKAKLEHSTHSRKHKEINIPLPKHESMKDLFLEIGLALYAHQEKDRTSYALQDWRFDIDQYPKMPAFMEIEGKDDNHIKEALEMLGLEKNKTWIDGERKLIKDIYGLNWFDMRF